MRHAETWDGVTDQQIFERDGWSCRIPGCELGPLQRDQAWPEPLAPVIDHIVPLSLGGADTAPNKRAAHGICNLRKGSKMLPGDVQIITPELAPLGLLPSLRKPGRVCVVCETERVDRAGATCPLCRKIARTERQEKALAMRRQGFAWDEIAVELGLSGSGAAYNVAYPPWDRYREGEVQKVKPSQRKHPRKRSVPGEKTEEPPWWAAMTGGTW